MLNGCPERAADSSDNDMIGATCVWMTFFKRESDSHVCHLTLLSLPPLLCLWVGECIRASSETLNLQWHCFSVSQLHVCLVFTHKKLKDIQLSHKTKQSSKSSHFRSLNQRVCGIFVWLMTQMIYYVQKPGDPKIQIQTQTHEQWKEREAVTYWRS